MSVWLPHETPRSGPRCPVDPENKFTCHKDWESIRAACLQNEVAPEKLLKRYEKRFEEREKDPKNDPKRVWKMFSPSQAA